MRLRELCLTVAMLLPIGAVAKDAAPGLPDLIDRLLPSVVNIINVSYVPIDDKQPATNPVLKKHLSYGSGFIITPNGLIATNKHVVAHGSEYYITFADGRRLRADLEGVAVGIDLAMLKARTSEILPAVTVGSSANVRRGDAVIAIGNPLGWSSSVSTGIISALDRDLKSSLIDHFFQTDAEINQGNSGGPMFNAAGEVIGINSAILTVAGSNGSVGIGFAIPIDDAKLLMESVLRYGRPRPAFFGAELQELDGDLADSLGLPITEGALVTGVSPASPAATAGVRVGDLMLGFDGKTEPNARALYRAIVNRPFDAKVVVDFMRDGATLHAPAALIEYPESMSLNGRASEAPGLPVPNPSADLGLTAAALTDAARAGMKLLPQAPGVMVQTVVPGSEADFHHISPGDVVMMVQSTPIMTASDLQQQIDALRAKNVAVARVLVADPDGRHFVPMRLK